MLRDDLSSGFDYSLIKSNAIFTDVLARSSIEWGNWRVGDVPPVIEFENFNFHRFFAETLINSFYNYVLDCVIVFDSISGEYLNPSNTTWFSSNVACRWTIGTDKNDHIDVLTKEFEKLALLEGDWDAPNIIASIISNEVHIMLTSGTIFNNNVLGVLNTIPNLTIASISVSGSLLGSNSSFTSDIANSLRYSYSNSSLGQSLDSAFSSYCKSLSGYVTGSGSAINCTGSAKGLAISSL